MTTQDAGQLTPDATDHLAQWFRGEVIRPTDPTYDDARRVWNGMIDRRPALIVRPTDADDVVAAVRFGRDRDLLIAVRGGGHSMPGYGTCDGGLVIDLSGMRGATVDPAGRTARVNGGALLGELDKAAQEHGLVCPVGVVSHTGVGGLTLGGGMGRLQRKHGFTIDNLRALEVVTADGRLVRASESENPDLFWAMRGAGPNFGVVTAFEFNLHPFDGNLIKATATYPAHRVRDAWVLFQELSETAPDEVMLTFAMWMAGPDELPAPLGGAPVVSVGAYHSGNQSTAANDLGSIMSAGEHALSRLENVSYLELQRTFDTELGWGHRVYTKGGFTDGLRDATLDAMAEHIARAGSGASFGVWAQGGAIARVPEDAMAFTGRSAAFQMSTESSWDDPQEDEERIEWGRAAYAIVEPHSRTGRYVNDVTDSGPDLARWIYGDAKYDRLVAVKRKWDPDNAFRVNQNIKP
jgi:FAD/FMN-containing dehydrogenase